MQVRPDQLAAHLARGLRPLYAVHGDDALLSQEAGDAVRAAARAAGHAERRVFTATGAHVDWSAIVGAVQERSLFAERQLLEIRIPSGKPGKDGSAALQDLCGRLSPEVVVLVQLPRLDFQQLKSAWFASLDGAGVTVRIETVDRAALPAWLAQRLARQGQRVEAGDAGQHTLAFFADRVEGNLLAAHQEVQKLALLHPPGELTLAQVQHAVLNVARFALPQLAEPLWRGQAARALKLLAGLRAEGEAPVLVHWTLAEDIRALDRARALLDAGRPLPLALKEARVWGVRERLFERVLPDLDRARTRAWLSAAQTVDGIVKGLKHPSWPHEPWDALQRLVLLLLEGQRATAAADR